jgi:ABC-type proline/glycine betaine transport system ATPase subunit
MTEDESKLYDENISYGVRLAVARALDRHKRLGFPIAVMKDGKVVRIPSEEIVVNYPPPEERPKQLPLTK